MKKKLTRSQQLVLDTIDEQEAMTYEGIADVTGLSYDGVRGRVSELTQMGYEIEKLREGVNTFVIRKKDSSYKRPLALKESMAQKIKAVDDFYKITDLLDELKANKTKTKKFPSVSKQGVEKSAMLLLSDLHMGQLIWDNEGDILLYDTETAYLRMDELTDAVIQHLKKEKINALTIVGLGDIIDGDMIYKNHIFRVEKPAVEQVQDAVRAISKSIKDFVASGLTIEMYNVRGNHGITNYKNLEEDNWDNVVYDMLELVFMDNDKVFIHNFKNSEGSFLVGDKNIIAYHGDRMGNQIKTASGLREFRGMCSKHALNYGDMIVVGHLHEFGFEGDLGKYLIRNGSVADASEYAYKLNLYSDPMQTLVIIEEDVKYPTIIPINLGD